MSLQLPLPAALILSVTNSPTAGLSVTTGRFANGYPPLVGQFYTDTKRLVDGTFNPMAGRLLAETVEVLERAQVRGKFT